MSNSWLLLINWCHRSFRFSVCKEHSYNKRVNIVFVWQFSPCFFLLHFFLSRITSDRKRQEMNGAIGKLILPAATIIILHLFDIFSLFLNFNFFLYCVYVFLCLTISILYGIKQTLFSRLLLVFSWTFFFFLFFVS